MNKQDKNSKRTFANQNYQVMKIILKSFCFICFG